MMTAESAASGTGTEPGVSRGVFEPPTNESDLPEGAAQPEPVTAAPLEDTFAAGTAVRFVIIRAGQPTTIRFPYDHRKERDKETVRRLNKEL